MGKWVDDSSLNSVIDKPNSIVTYYGYAEPGVLKSDSTWLIRRDVISGNITDTEWASQSYDKVWNDRATYFGAIPFSNTKSINFDGANDHILVNDHADFDFGAAMTASCWIKGSGQDSGNYFASWDTSSQRSWLMKSDAGAEGNKLEVILSDDGTVDGGSLKRYISSVVVLNNSWHHISFTWGSNTLKLYIDGTEDTSVNKLNDDAITSLHNSTAKLTIGAALGGGSPISPFAGNLDEPILFNVALTATDITNIYNSGSPNDLSIHAKYSNAVAWWRMGDGMSSTTVPDEKNSNDGTMTNMNYPGDIETDVP